MGDFSPESTKCTGVLMGVDYYYSWCLNGVDYYYSCITGKVKRGKDYEPLAINAFFELIVCGYNKHPISTNFANGKHMLRTNTELLNIFDEIKTENTFNDDLKKLFYVKNY